MDTHERRSRFGVAGLPWVTIGGRAAAGVALWAALALPGQAGVIRMQTTCSVVTNRLTVQIVNTGTEAAQNVRTTVTFMGQEYQTDPIDSLAPNVPKQDNFRLDIQGMVGTYPAVILTDFEDLNSYPFSAVSVRLIRGSQAGSSPLVGVLAKKDFAVKTRLPLKISNSGDEELDVTCRILTPRELASSEPEFTVKIPAKGNVERTVKIENLSGTPNSGLPVHCLLEHEKDGVHFCAVASTSVMLTTPSAASNRGFWIVVAIVAAVAAVLLALLLRGKK